MSISTGLPAIMFAPAVYPTFKVNGRAIRKKRSGYIKGEMGRADAVSSVTPDNSIMPCTSQ
ncbi:hypothetical protein [Siminovitchia sp. 179-K 8D1 HS]|uniref:hypothetical protein n=1 Tax=Siminovitchia sp. 179-K 8D1 HS TaxID=3142385 RepID=UPI0039A038A5